VSNFANDRHALFCGWVMGRLVHQGVRVRSCVDEHMNYLPRVHFIEDDPAQCYDLDIPEPSEDWRL